MKNKIYQKVLKRVFMFVVPLVFLLPVISFAQSGEYNIDFDDYNLSIWDFSGYYDEQPIPDGTVSFTLMQDAQGKLTGYGLLDYYSSEYGISVDDIESEFKGKVKTSNNIVTLKFTSKGEKINAYIDGEYYNVKVKFNVSLVLDVGSGALVGTVQGKICAKGVGCDSGASYIEIDLLPGMTGEAELEIDVKSEDGKKLEGSGELILSNDDKYPLYVKGKYNSKNDETKYSLKGVTDSTKGIKFKLIINEGSGDTTGIKAKALGQKLIH